MVGGCAAAAGSPRILEPRWAHSLVSKGDLFRPSSAISQVFSRPRANSTRTTSLDRISPLVDDSPPPSSSLLPVRRANLLGARLSQVSVVRRRSRRGETAELRAGRFVSDASPRLLSYGAKSPRAHCRIGAGSPAGSGTNGQPRRPQWPPFATEPAPLQSRPPPCRPPCRPLYRPLYRPPAVPCRAEEPLRAAVSDCRYAPGGR